MWNAFVEVIRATIFAGSHLFNGSLGASILFVSAIVRLALLPLALRSARLAREQQARLAQLKPQLDRLQARHRTDPVRLMTETQALHAKHGISVIPRGSLIPNLVQMPLLGGLFAAVRGGLGVKVRFLWIVDLSRADVLLASIVAGLAGVASAIAPAPSAPGPRAAALVVAAVTLAFLWSASSAVALSVGAGTAVSALQQWILRRESKR